MNAKTPFFSVVIPVYNRAKIIRRCVDSVLNQSYSDFEIVIIDDGSVDEIEEAVSAISDPRIRFIRQPNGGGSRARNRGIEESQGQFIAFLDSDDVFLPDHLKIMHGIVEGRDDIVAFSQVIVDRGAGKTFLKPPRAPGADETIAEYLCCARGFVQTSTLVIPTALARKVQYRIGMPFGQDTDFAIRLAIAGGQFVMAEKPGAIWNDAFDPMRVSSRRKGVANLGWIEEMRPLIADRAYHGYRGWHIAKGVVKTDKWKALGLFLTAIRHGSYKPALAGVVFCQIFIPDHVYHNCADFVVRMIGSDKRATIEPVS